MLEDIYVLHSYISYVERMFLHMIETMLIYIIETLWTGLRLYNVVLLYFKVEVVDKTWL